MVDNHGLDVFYASLTLHAKPPPVAMRNQLNTNKSLWSARRDSSKDVWSTSATKETKTEEPLPELRRLPQKPVNKDHKTSQTYRKPFYKKYWMLTAFLCFVVTTSLLNILFWVILINIRNSNKPYCRPTIVVESRKARPKPQAPVYKECQLYPEEIPTDFDKSKDSKVNEQRSPYYPYDRESCQKYGRSIDVKLKMSYILFSTYIWTVCDVKIKIKKDFQHDDYDDDGSYQVMLNSNTGSKYCFESNQSYLAGMHGRYSQYVFDCKGKEGSIVTITKNYRKRYHPRLKSDEKDMVICDVAVTGKKEYKQPLGQHPYEYHDRYNQPAKHDDDDDGDDDYAYFG